MWALWVNYNELWDRIDAYDNNEFFVDRLCSFINPEAMKSYLDKKANEVSIDTVSKSKAGPNPKVKLPDSVLSKLLPSRLNKLDLKDIDSVDDIEIG